MKKKKKTKNQHYFNKTVWLSRNLIDTNILFRMRFPLYSIWSTRYSVSKCPIFKQCMQPVFRTIHNPSRFFYSFSFFFFFQIIRQNRFSSVKFDFEEARDCSNRISTTGEEKNVQETNLLVFIFAVIYYWDQYATSTFMHFWMVLLMEKLIHFGKNALDSGSTNSTDCKWWMVNEEFRMCKKQKPSVCSTYYVRYWYGDQWFGENHSAIRFSVFMIPWMDFEKLHRLSWFIDEMLVENWKFIFMHFSWSCKNYLIFIVVHTVGQSPTMYPEGMKFISNCS